MNTVAFDPTTREEEAFPLAFAFTVHENIAIVEMFLALFFRPTDYHCIHVDIKASDETLANIKSIVTCYQEMFPHSKIFLARNPVPVFWAQGGTMMEADMLCYKQLMELSETWKMVANVAGSELPFVSHQKFREVLKRSGGSVVYVMPNDIPGRQTEHYQLKR